MRRVLAVLVMIGWLGLVAAPAVGAGDDTPPDRCFVMKDGELPTCFLRDDGTWSVSYPESGGIGGSGYAAIFLLVAMAATGIAVWRLTLTRKVARVSGADVDQALVTDQENADRRREINDEA